MNRMIMVFSLAVICIVALPVRSVRAAEPWESDRTFWLNMNWNDGRANPESTASFDATTLSGRVQGKTLSPQTIAVKETIAAQKRAPQGYRVWPLSFKNLPTGASNQAVEFPAAGIVNPKAGAISFFVQGTGWDIASPARETLVTLDGKAGSLAVEKNRSGMLAVTVNGSPVVEAPFAVADRCHHVVVTYAGTAKGGAAIALYIDRKKVAEKTGVKLPASYDRIAVGQLGDGPGTNKMMDNVSLYRRPLLQGEITKLFSLEGKIELPKLVVIPYRPSPPTVDGIFSPGEWDRAAELCGFVDEAQDSYVIYFGTGKPWIVRDTVRLAYDDRCLYFAYHCPPPEKIRDNAPIIAAMLQSTKAGFDTDVDSDDSFFIDIHRGYPYGDMYHLIVNGINTHYEFSDGGIAPGSIEKGRMLGFNPRWITASTLTLEGWKLEGEIPWADLRMAPPRPGGELTINFSRNWKTVLTGMASWAHGDRHGPNDDIYFVPAGTLKFGGPQDVFVRLEQVGYLDRGALDFAAVMVNPGPAPAAVQVALTSNSGEINAVRELSIPAGGSVPWNLRKQTVNPLTGEVVFTVRDAKTGAPIYTAGYPVIRKDHPDIYFRKYPSWKLVKFEVDFSSLNQTPAGDITASLQVVRKGSGAVVAGRKAGKFRDYAHVFEVSTADMQPGPYEARCSFAARGKTLDAVVFPFELKPLPSWYNNTIGYDDPKRPPYPFTYMELRNKTDVCVWGRDYRFGDRLLPEQIEIRPDQEPPTTPYPGNGQRILRAPMRLTGEADGRAFSTDGIPAVAAWKVVTPTRISGTRSFTTGNLSVTADLWVEYDGLCWVNLTLAPVSGSVELTSLVLEELFTKEFSDVVNGGEYSLVGTGDMPKEPMVKSAVRPIWVGNGEGGLQTFLETVAMFHVKNLQTTMQLVPGPDGATVRITMVDKPLVLSGPRTIEFGFNATPVRPREWRTPREQSLGRRNSYFMWFSGPEWLPGDDGWFNYVYWNSGFITPVFSAGWGGYWHRSQPYMTLDAVTLSDTDVQEFGDEWLRNQEDRWRERVGKPGEIIMVTHHAKSYRDWVLYRMKRLFDERPFVGVYYDVTGPVASANPYADAGIAREDGSRVATDSLLGLRDTVKRIYVLCRKTYPDGSIMFHDSGAPIMAYMAFCEVFFDGENLNSQINAQAPTYRGVMTPGRFRAEYMGHNWGPQVWWLAQGRVKPETVKQYGADILEDHVAGLMLLHDAPVIFAGGFSGWHSDEANRRTLDAIRTYELYGCGYRFLPYWKHPPVSGLRENQYASFYIRSPLQVQPDHWRFFTRNETDETLPHRVVGIFCNESDWQGEMAVTVDPAGLGFKPGAKIRAVNAVHSTGYRVENIGTPREKGVYFPKPEETALLEGNVLKFPLSGWNYRMIVLEEER